MFALQNPLTLVMGSISENGLCYVPRHLQFKQLDRKSMLSLNNEAYIANVIDGHALPVSVLYK